MPPKKMILSHFSLGSFLAVHGFSYGLEEVLDRRLFECLERAYSVDESRLDLCFLRHDCRGPCAKKEVCTQSDAVVDLCSDPEILEVSDVAVDCCVCGVVVAVVAEGVLPLKKPSMFVNVLSSGVLDFRRVCRTNRYERTGLIDTEIGDK
jgi:hypothetical protein